MAGGERRLAMFGERVEGEPREVDAPAPAGLRFLEPVVSVYLFQRPLSYAIGDGLSDEQNGYLGINSELAHALSRAEPEEEVTADLEGQERRFIFMIHEQAVMGRLSQGEMAGPFHERALSGQLFLVASPVLLLMPLE